MSARRLTAAGLVLAALLVLAAGLLWEADRSRARAAFAEFEAVAAEGRRATATAARARQDTDALPPADRARLEVAAVEAERVARDAAAHADRLRAEWGDRWRRLGLEAR